MGKDEGKKKINLAVAALVMAGAGTLICLTGFAMGGRPGFYTTDEGLFTAEGIYRKKNGEVVNLKKQPKNNKSMQKTELTAFDSIRIAVDDAKVEIIPSDGYYMEYCIDEDSSPELSLENGTLVFHENEAAGSGQAIFYNSFSAYYWFYDSRDFDWNKKAGYYVKIYVPEEAEFASVEITGNDGGAKLVGLNAKQLTCELSYGDLQLDGWRGETAQLTLGNGDLTAKGNLNAAQSCTIENSFGNVRMKTVTSPSCTINMGNGDLHMTMGAGTALDVTNSFGKAEVSVDGKLQEYDIYLNAAFGNVKVPVNFESSARSGDGNSSTLTRKADGTPKGSLIVNAGNGDIRVKES